jgi:hypothetical protein
VKLALRALAAVAVLLGAAVAGLALLLPRLVDRPEMRARIEAAARDATGRELTYQALSARVLPPEIDVESPVLAAEVAGDPPLFTAERVALRLQLLPLLARTIVIDRLRVEGARVHLVRTQRAKPQAPPSAASASAAPSAPSASASPIASLGVRTVDVKDAEVTLEDRTVTPPLEVVLEGISASAHAASFDTSIQLEAKAHIRSGGDVALQGTSTLAGVLDATATLRQVEAKPFAATLGQGRLLEGKLSGTVHATGPATAPTQLDAKLVFDDARVQIDAVKLSGKLGISARLSQQEGGLGGPFEIDATAAELGYGGSFRKPPGSAATTSGTLKPRAGGGFDVDELRVKIKNFDAHGSFQSGPPAAVALDAPAFELAGWEQLVPPLAGIALGGRITVAGFRASAAPLNVGGAVLLDAVRLSAPGEPPILLQGRIEATGNAIRSQDLGLDVAGQPVAIALGAAPLDRSPVGTLSATGQGIDAGALIAAFSKSGASVTGPLQFDARFQAPLASGRPISEVASGMLDFSLGPGTFKGVSVMRQAIERSGPVVQAAVAAGQAFGGRDVKRMYDDRFERISGQVKLAGGMARFDPIEAVYRDYRLDLRGSVRLSDRALDASGKLIFADAKGAGAMRGQTLSISHIGGTVDKPHVELSPEEIAAVAAQASGSALERKIDPFIDKLRKEAAGGGSPLDALKSLFGGKKRN